MAQVNWSEKNEKYWVKDLKGENLLFDSVIDAANAARRIETERAVADEVSRIVVWLRSLETRDGIIEELAETITNNIERGDYK